ncbi:MULTISPECIES: translation initiation factor SUI1 [Prochlorococcus]|uniref:Translation initiation factor SUI1-related protein n=1 Tax=Prochlorococcus marinus str. MIT 9116 TaxID=167544 RepID=A0A0A1ZKS4_PROMR|nr:translation initiation factor SUI1 [Prochlorococcus marinus]KGF89244.1 Translation initiation factor SUI1-related protein [Prochlorococcus marinus str. MIT 9107]KGF90000.1 Translation initiation factor SUI1-related protein [Prochlorococcus marinus str. MIT 9116]KGF95436.1 Translation initiation factor SUI1-related protein [Prochlorococcus marinus str. MIT 9123]
MGKKNWIEFENHENKSEETAKINTFNKRSKINISKQKKGKKGKTITLIQGLETENEILLKELLKKIKVFCGTGGTLIDSNIQLQGDMVSKSIEFLSKEGFQNL